MGMQCGKQTPHVYAPRLKFNTALMCGHEVWLCGTNSQGLQVQVQIHQSPCLGTGSGHGENNSPGSHLQSQVYCSLPMLAWDLVMEKQSPQVRIPRLKFSLPAWVWSLGEGNKLPELACPGSNSAQSLCLVQGLVMGNKFPGFAAPAQILCCLLACAQYLATENNIPKSCTCVQIHLSLPA